MLEDLVGLKAGRPGMGAGKNLYIVGNRLYKQYRSSGFSFYLKVLMSKTFRINSYTCSLSNQNSYYMIKDIKEILLFEGSWQTYQVSFVVEIWLHQD